MEARYLPLLLVRYAPDRKMSYEDLHARIAALEVVLAVENPEAELFYAFVPDNEPVYSVELNQDIIRLLSSGELEFGSLRGTPVLVLTQHGLGEAEKAEKELSTNNPSLLKGLKDQGPVPRELSRKLWLLSDRSMAFRRRGRQARAQAKA